MPEEPNERCGRKGRAVGTPSPGTWAEMKAAFDAVDHAEFIDSVAACMRMRKKVNIKKIVGKVDDVLGENYAAIAEKILRQAALRSGIIVEGDKP